MPEKPRYRFEVRILSKFCKGCALCVEFCPAEALAIDKKPNQFGVQQAYIVSGKRCTGCQRCVLICPDAAIEIVRHCAVEAKLAY